MTPSDDTPLLMTATATVSGDRLVIDYTLTQSGTEPVYAVDLAPDVLSNSRLDPAARRTHAWVYQSDDGPRISKQGFAIAPTIRFFAAPVMGVKRVDPGASITGSAEVGWPLATALPSAEFEAPRGALSSASAERVRLCIQVMDAASVDGGQAATGTELKSTPVVPPRPGELICIDVAIG